MKAYTIAQEIARAAQQRQWSAYIVGGFVRDKIVGMQSKDIDIELFGPQSFSELVEFASRFGRANEVGDTFSVVKIHINGEEPLDISLPGGATSLYEASLRRDFTFNAMFLDPLTEKIIDYHNGISDLRKHRLVHTSDQFSVDPLRVLRGAQLCSRFNLIANRSTVALCNSLSDKYGTLSIERVGEEWEKLFRKSIKPSRAIIFLHNTGWLNFYPQLKAILRIPQDPQYHPEGSVYRHSLKCADVAARLNIDPENRYYVTIAALLHDVGKAQTTTIDNGKISSRNHESAGVDLAIDFLSSIRATQLTKDVVSRLIKEHMVFSCCERLSPSAIRKLAARLYPATIEQLTALVYCDANSRGKRVDTSYLQTVRAIAITNSCKDSIQPSILKGRHLIELGFKPGPLFSKIIAAAYESQLSGSITSLDEAKSFALQFNANMLTDV